MTPQKPSRRRAVTLTGLLAAAALTATLAAPAAAAAELGRGDSGLQVGAFLGEVRIAPGGQYAGTTVGGFSGLDRDRRTGRWFIISDDRSALQPARFYTADLAFDGPDGALTGVNLTGTRPFRRPDGTTYPPLATGDGTTVDPEDIRVDPITGRLLWSQEGERIVPTNGAAPTLIDPTVRFARRDGSFVSQLRTPDDQRVTAGNSGIRQNLGPEGLTVALGGLLVVTALEAPLLQDGPVATRTSGALSRIVVQSRDGRLLHEYAYPQEPLFADPVPAGAFATTGVSAILAVDGLRPDRFLVVERSFVTGVGNKVRVFEVSTAGATDVAGRGLGGASPVTKRLLFDVADLPVASVDNIEGLAWGPERADGSRPLVLVSDDNFSATQVTQFIAVQIRSGRGR